MFWSTYMQYPLSLQVVMAHWAGQNQPYSLQLHGIHIQFPLTDLRPCNVDQKWSFLKL